MKTRNNQSNADETILNQSITRRSFVKRGAVASAATVFGAASVSVTKAHASQVIYGPHHITYQTTAAYQFNDDNATHTATEWARILQNSGKLGPGTPDGPFVNPIPLTPNRVTQGTNGIPAPTEIPGSGGGAPTFNWTVPAGITIVIQVAY